MRSMTVQELSNSLESVDSRLLLLDVREPHEYAYCHIGGSLNIPMNTVPTRLSEIDANRDIVTICHHGMRSAKVQEYLIQQGYPQVTNLSGGIDAWAMQVDLGMRRY